MEFASLHEFTARGMEAFEKVFTGKLDDAVIAPEDPVLASPVAGTRSFTPVRFETSKEMAGSILVAMDRADPLELLDRSRLWAWLTFVLRDQLFRRSADGAWKVGERHRWYPSNPDDWQKGQRHLVRMPVLLRHQLGDTVDHLLCSAPAVLPEIREQLTSQKDMFNRAFQQVARSLYFDETGGALKRGAGGKGAGSSRRLAKVRQQLDVTWSIEDLEPARIMALLPQEFARFKEKVSGTSDRPRQTAGNGRQEMTDTFREKYGDPGQGYQWQTVLLPNGTNIRMSYGDRDSYAEIRHGRLYFGDASMSPSQFARRVANNTSRNAWRDLYIRFPGEDRWILADLLRQQMSSRSDSQWNQEIHRSGTAS